MLESHRSRVKIVSRKDAASNEIPEPDPFNSCHQCALV